MKAEQILKPIVIFIYRHRAVIFTILAVIAALWFILAYCNFNLSYFGNALLWIISSPLWIAVLSWIVKPKPRTDP